LLHKYPPTVTPVTLAVSIADSPTQITFGSIVTTGNGLTVTVVLADEIHPAVLDTVTLYSVVAVGLTTIDAVVAPLLHKYPPTATPVTLAVSVVDSPTQIVAGFIVTTGISLTVTVALADEVHPAVLDTVTL
jgi:hypothetical protein